MPSNMYDLVGWILFCGVIGSIIVIKGEIWDVYWKWPTTKKQKRAYWFFSILMICFFIGAYFFKN